jgi:hypothetical protein
VHSWDRAGKLRRRPPPKTSRGLLWLRPAEPPYPIQTTQAARIHGFSQIDFENANTIALQITFTAPHDKSSYLCSVVVMLIATEVSNKLVTLHPLWGSCQLLKWTEAQSFHCHHSFWLLVKRLVIGLLGADRTHDQLDCSTASQKRPQSIGTVKLAVINHVFNLMGSQ